LCLAPQLVSAQNLVADLVASMEVGHKLLICVIFADIIVYMFSGETFENKQKIIQGEQQMTNYYMLWTRFIQLLC